MPPEPLTVDPELLAQGGGELLAAAGDLPPAPTPFVPTGSDPLSLTIIAQVPFAEGPISIELPAIKTGALGTASNIQAAAEHYSQTDRTLGAELEQHQFNQGDAPGAAGQGGAQNAASQAGQMGQMMGMPMQMAQQAAQLPMQLMGMAAAVPQGIMQGVQGAMQQVGQLGGQLEKPSGDEAKTAEYADQQREQPAKDNGDKDTGAAPAQPGGERAPEPGGPAPGPAQPAPPAPRVPAPTRPAEAIDF